MDTVDPKVLDSMDKALAAAFKTRMQARSGKKKKNGEITVPPSDILIGT